MFRIRQVLMKVAPGQKLVSSCTDISLTNSAKSHGMKPRVRGKGAGVSVEKAGMVVGDNMTVGKEAVLAGFTGGKVEVGPAICVSRDMAVCPATSVSCRSTVWATMVSRGCELEIGVCVVVIQLPNRKMIKRRIKEFRNMVVLILIFPQKLTPMTIR
jgi:hypothetical protein